MYSIFILEWFCCFYFAGDVSSVNKALLWGIWRRIKMIIYTELSVGLNFYIDISIFSKDCATDGTFTWNGFFY